MRRAKVSDFDMPKEETAASRVKASATMPVVEGLPKWCGAGAKGEDDEGKFADLSEVERGNEAGAQDLVA